MRARLRTISQFDAFLLDHFKDIAHLVPQQSDRLAQENALLKCVGPQAVLRAVYGPRYYLAWMAMTMCVLGGFAALGVGVLWMVHKEPRQPVSEHLVRPQTGPSSATVSPPPAPNGSSFGVLVAPGSPLLLTATPSASIAKLASKRAVAGKSCTQGIVATRQAGSLRYQAANLPAGHGYSRGIKVALLAVDGAERGHRLGYGSIVEVEARDLALVAEHLEQLPPRLCATPLGESIQVGRALGKLLPSGHINMGSGDGVRIGDRYEVLGEAIADADAAGRSLGRSGIGVLRVTAVESTHATVFTERGEAPAGSFVRALAHPAQGRNP